MRQSITAGLVVGLATGIWMFGEFALGLHDTPDGAGRWTGFLSLIFPLIGAYWLTRKEPLSSWVEALREGLLFGAVGGVVSGTAIYLYFTAVNPHFMVDGQNVDPLAQALIGFVGGLILGGILVPVMYLLFKRKRTTDV